MLRAALRSLLQHKLRLALTLAAVVVGVAFVAGTYIFTDSLKRSFDALFTAPQPDVSVTVDTGIQQGPGGGPGAGQGGDQAPTLPGADVEKVAAVEGAAAAYGVVASDGAIVIGSDGEVVGRNGPPARGTTFVPDSAISPLTVSVGAAPAGPDQVALLEQTAEAAGVGVGDTVKIDTPAGGLVTLTVSGLVTRGVAGSDGSTLAVFDLPTAQKLLLGKGDVVTSVAVRAEAGVPQDVLAQRIKAAVPDVATQTGAQRSAQIADRLEETFQFVNTFLLAFALIALFVAIFLIFNTFSMLVAQRTRELALLRAVGATRGQVQRSVLVEALVLGLLAAVLGVAGGILVSQGLRLLLRAFGADLPAGPLVIEPRTVVISLVVGVVVTLVSAFVPARRAGVVPPVAAMRDEIELPTRSLRIRTAIGAVLLVLGVVAAQRGIAVSTSDAERGAQLVGLSALCSLIAVIALAPMIGRGVLVVLAAPFQRGPVGRLARENGRRNPRRTAATASALAIGLALMTAIGVIAASTKASVAAVVDDTIGADFVIFGAKFQPFSPEVYQAVKDTPGTSVVTYVRQVPIQVQSDRTALTGVDTEKFPQVVDLTMQSGEPVPDLALGQAIVDDGTAKDLGLAVGDTVPATFVNGKSELTLQGIYTAAGPYRGWITGLPTLESIGARELDSAVYIRVAPDGDPDAVRAELDRELAAFPTVDVQDQASLKDQVNSQFDRVFGFIYALLALAVIVAFLGIVNTLALSVHERRREVGLLRAVGTSRSQVRRMVVLEAVLISVFGALLGVALGAVFGALLQKVLEPQGITELAVPTGQILGFLGLAVAGGFVAALWPATTAARLDVLRAIASE